MPPAILSQTEGNFSGAFPFAFSMAHDASGADCLLVFWHFGNSFPFVPTCTYNGIAMSLVAHAAAAVGDCTVYAWALNAPPAGSHTLAIASPGVYGGEGVCWAVNVVDSDPISPVASGAAVAGVSPRTASLVLTGGSSTVFGSGSTFFNTLDPYTGVPTPTVIAEAATNPHMPARLVSQAAGAAGSTVSLTFDATGPIGGAIVEVLGPPAGLTVDMPSLPMSFGLGAFGVVTRQDVVAGPLPMSFGFGSFLVDVGGLFAQSVEPDPMPMSFGIGAMTVTRGAEFGGFPATLNPGSSLNVSVRFAPMVTGARTGSLVVTSNAASSPDAVALSGTAIGALTYLHTVGNQVVDGHGNNVRLVSANWYGFEHVRMPGGCWDTAYKTVTVAGVVVEGVMDRIKRLGFNSIRLPICEDVSWPGCLSKPDDGLSAPHNPDLYQPGTNLLTATAADRIPSIEMLDKVVAYAAELGLRIILDMHCLAPNPNNVLGTQGRWYSTPTPGAAGGTTLGLVGQPRNEAQWIEAWVFYAQRYAGQPAVAGFDLVNEPHDCTWDNDPNTGWPAAAERCAAAIQAVNPDALIIVEGVYSLITFPDGFTQGCFWAEDLRGVGARPVVTPVPGRVLYSSHDYGSFPFFGAPDAIFARAASDHALYASWLRTCWGYLIEGNIAPVWIGEYGSYFIAGSGGGAYTAAYATKDVLWIDVLTKYAGGDFNLDGVSELPAGKVGVGTAYWCYNSETQDGAGIMQADHVTVNQFVLDRIVGMMAGG